MFTSKKKKISTYLQGISIADRTGFDHLLLDYLDGTLKRNMADMGITKIELFIDWHDHLKCIGVQGRFQKYYLDIQIYPAEFSLSFDLDEPDEDESYPMESKDHFYQTLSNMIHRLM